MANIHSRLTAIALIVLSTFGTHPARGESREDSGLHGYSTRTVPKPYLKMPRRAGGEFPLLLSQTGAFDNTRNLRLNQALIPYDIVVAFWSDGADKSRSFAIPNGKIKFSPGGEWGFPKGTVFVKTFELSTDEALPDVKRRLETRLLMYEGAGRVYGATYKWRADESDADLLTTSLTEDISIKTVAGERRNQTWYYPSRQDCLTCHTVKAGGVLGVKTRQMNRDFAYSSGVTANQLRTLSRLGLLEPSLKESDLSALPKLARANDATRSLEDRVRSYLDANCAHCHRPGGTVAYFDARYDTPLAKQELIEGPVLIDHGIDRPKVISPHDIWRSIALMRVNTVGDIKMPPLARETIDQQGVALLKQWIMSLPGRAVVDPPVISPAGGTYDAPLEVSLKTSEPGAEIRYTLDGSMPGKSDMRYEKPIKLTDATVLRARAFKEGFTRSITVQEVFIIGK